MNKFELTYKVDGQKLFMTIYTESESLARDEAYKRLLNLAESASFAQLLSIKKI